MRGARRLLGERTVDYGLSANDCVKGKAFEMSDLPNNCYVFGRHVMTCCADDIGGIGFLCQFKNQPPRTNDWIFLDAKVEKSFSPLHNTDAIILIEEKVSPATPHKEEMVYFN